ncbi:hypothetical protein MTO96_046732, partial [Rhipicephalus appendiculatus]
ILGFVGFTDCTGGAASTDSTDGGFDKGSSCNAPGWCIHGAQPPLLRTDSDAMYNFPQFAFLRSVTATATSTTRLPDPLKAHLTDLIASGHGRTTKMWHSRFLFIVAQILGFVGFADCTGGAASTDSTDGGFDKGSSCNAPGWCIHGAQPPLLRTDSDAMYNFPQFAFPRSVTATATSTTRLSDPLKAHLTDLIASGHGRTTKMWHSRFLFIVAQILGFVRFADCTGGAASTDSTDGGFDKGSPCNAPGWCIHGAQPPLLRTDSDAMYNFPQFAFPRNVTATATSTTRLPDSLKAHLTDLIASGHGCSNQNVALTILVHRCAG